jgi:hypothetical protein
LGVPFKIACIKLSLLYCTILSIDWDSSFIQNFFGKKFFCRWPLLNNPVALLSEELSVSREKLVDDMLTSRAYIGSRFRNDDRYTNEQSEYGSNTLTYEERRAIERLKVILT